MESGVEESDGSIAAHLFPRDFPDRRLFSNSAPLLIVALGLQWTDL